MLRVFLIVLISIILGATLGGLLVNTDAQVPSVTMTFESLGFNTATGTSHTIDFTSPYNEASGEVKLHFQTFAPFVDLFVYINGALVYRHIDYASGSQWDSIPFPTGVVDKDTTNTLKLVFSEAVTVYEDSCITIRETSQFGIVLKAGWNMVSIPVITCDKLVGTVFSGVAAVYTWDPVSRSYVVPITIEPDTGYWVAVVADRTLTITGGSVTTWISDIKAGWNMIGAPFNAASISDPNDSPDGCVQPFAYWWDPVSKTYVYTTDIDPGKGYWVASVQDCTLTMP